MLSFAKMLKQAYTGDVEFVFRNGGQGEDGAPLKLYAFRHILEGMDNGRDAAVRAGRSSGRSSLRQERDRRPRTNQPEKTSPRDRRDRGPLVLQIYGPERFGRSQCKDCGPPRLDRLDRDNINRLSCYIHSYATGASALARSSIGIAFSQFVNQSMSS